MSDCRIRQSLSLSWKEMTAFPAIRKQLDRRRCHEAPKAIFVWIPKTAGTSLNAAFAQCGCRKFKSLKRIQRGFYADGFVTFVHLSLARLVEDKVIPLAYYQQALRFAFVRHPVARAQSLYGYLSKKQVISSDTSFSDFLDLLERAFEQEQQNSLKLDSFTRRLLNWEGDDLRLHEGAVPPPGLYNSYALSQCRPQVEWLRCPAGEASVSDGWGCAGFIGRVEHLSRDLSRLQNELGINIPVPPRLNQSQSHISAISCADRKKIARLYEADYSAFGYSD